MSLLLCADLHLTELPRDEDRWNLFPWIESQVEKHDIENVAILGDLTDAKNNHPEKLVNHVVRVISSLSKKVQVIILKGNHDFIEESSPYFRFLGKLKNVVYVNKPMSIDFGKVGTGLFLPCTKSPASWQIKTGECANYDYIFTHQTYDGCLSENGTKLNGVPPSIFSWFNGKVWSGDIHVAQKVGKKIEYVGAPYPIRFGDSFDPRCILLTGPVTHKVLKFPHRIKKLIEAKSIDDFPTLPPKSQVKIRFWLSRADYANWPNIRTAIQKHVFAKEWELCGLELDAEPTVDTVADTVSAPIVAEADGVVSAYAKDKKLGKKTTEVGLNLIKDAMK